MVIGIDLRPLQTGHKYRGIGEVAKQVTNHILQYSQTMHENKPPVSFIFYEYDIDKKEDDPKRLLSLPKNISYSEIFVGTDPESTRSRTKPEKLAGSYAALYGDAIKGSDKCDVFLQFAYEFGVPKNTKTILVIHDFIPDIFWNSYFESAWVPFKNKAIRTTLRTLYANYKQATFGTVQHQNNNFDLRNAFKTNAWMQVSHLTPDEAKENYIQIISSILNKKI